MAVRGVDATGPMGWTYAQLQTKVNQIAHVLVHDMGLKSGERLLLRGGNSPMMAACFLAALKAGLVVVPTMPLLRASELKQILDKAQVKAALCDSLLAEELAHCIDPSHAHFASSLQQTLWFRSSDEEGVEARIAKHAKEFEAATQGMKIGESKTFPLVFPEDYQGKDVAGKTADFMVTLKKLEAAHLPEVDDAMAKSLGIPDGTVDAMRADIRKNLQREVKFRLLSRNKQAAMDALVARADFDLPRSSVMSEVDRMVANAREELKQRGVKDADKAPIPQEMFRAQAERRVRLGLVVAELVRANSLAAKPEQLKAHIEELASSYEKPAEVLRWYYGDNQRMAEVEAVVIESNVSDFVLAQAKVVEKAISFEELMGQQG